MASLNGSLTKASPLKGERSEERGRPSWKRKFLGYSMTVHRKPRLTWPRVHEKGSRRSSGKSSAGGEDRALGRSSEELKPLLRGWVAYFKLAEARNMFEELDGWIRRKLRCLLWRQWKRVYPRVTTTDATRPR